VEAANSVEALGGKSPRPLQTKCVGGAVRDGGSFQSDHTINQR